MSPRPSSPAATPVLRGRAGADPMTVRFAQALRQAMVANHASQRDLCELLEVRIGTLTKYLAGDIHPMKVGLGIQAALARALGVTLDVLADYYESGELVSQVSVREVESWLRSEAGQEDLPRILASLQDAGQRWLHGGGAIAPLPELDLVPYTWPAEEVEELGLSTAMRQRLGLTEEDLAPLVERGEFTDELVEAFSVAANYELAAVREAFATRQPIL